MHPAITLVLQFLAMFAMGWIFGDMHGWRKGWNEGMKLVDRYRTMISRLVGEDSTDLECQGHDHKDLPS